MRLDSGARIRLILEGGRLSYYDRIAGRWDKVTGRAGGAFKRLVLNDRILGLIGDVSGRDVLEIGAGNSYLARLLWRRHSGREPGASISSWP